MIKNNRILPVFIAFLGLLSSCSDGFEAFEGSGKTITENRNVGSFNSIVLNDNIDLIIGFDTLYTLRIEAPENWMDEIITRVNNNTLELKNTSTWLWLKDPNKKITAYLTAPSIQCLRYYGTGYVDSPDTLRTGTFLMEILDGSGNIRFNIQADTLYLKNMDGVADIRVDGTTDYEYVFNSTVSNIDCRKLYSKVARIVHNGSGNCYVQSQKVLSVSISRMGDVYYTGNPDTIISSIIGSGQLIPF